MPSIKPATFNATFRCETSQFFPHVSSHGHGVSPSMGSLQAGLYSLLVQAIEPGGLLGQCPHGGFLRILLDLWLEIDEKTNLNG